MQSRLLPFTVAGIICFAAAFFLGATFWYFFGTNPRRYNDNSKTTIQVSNQNPAVNAANSNEAAPTPSPTPEPKKAPAGEAAVAGGEVTLGGGDTKLPLRRVAVSDFSIGETEVSNEEYAAFVEAANYKAPAYWKDGRFPPGTGKEPVVGVTWTDATAYCEWLSKQIGATVRLPNEAEWTLAARGNTENQYPWGAEWKDDAAASAETNGKILPVRSFPAGRSPSGAYEMIGNVWEWTSDLASDEFGRPILFGKAKQRIIKGGSAREERKYLTVAARASRPEDRGSDTLGFRYVIIRK
ncbi:MAG TPA: SUMF1/EgtB/PvdO family nonheme iron enzyme [Pyrinomonadaceae bacterium]|jgi:formylglycine-generating enzyme required for sulfatase activity